MSLDSWIFPKESWHDEMGKTLFYIGPVEGLVLTPVSKDCEKGLMRFKKLIKNTQLSLNRSLGNV